jgi:hypothetical protein
VQVVLDSARADEQLRADLGIGESSRASHAICGPLDQGARLGISLVTPRGERPPCDRMLAA